MQMAWGLAPCPSLYRRTWLPWDCLTLLQIIFLLFLFFFNDNGGITPPTGVKKRHQAVREEEAGEEVEVPPERES